MGGLLLVSVMVPVLSSLPARMPSPSMVSLPLPELWAMVSPAVNPPSWELVPSLLLEQCWRRLECLLVRWTRLKSMKHLQLKPFPVRKPLTSPLRNSTPVVELLPLVTLLQLLDQEYLHMWFTKYAAKDKNTESDQLVLAEDKAFQFCLRRCNM